MDAAHRSRFSINQCMDRCRVTKMRSPMRARIQLGGGRETDAVHQEIERGGDIYG
jgi:hypothetical protein